MADRKINLLLAAKDAASGPIGRVRGSLASLDRSAGGIPGRLKGVGASIVKLGAVAALGVAGLVAGAAAAGASFFGLSAKLEQMGAKAETVFGDTLPQVKAWAKANAGAMGLTSAAATGLAANFGDLLIPMGFTREQAAKMSTDVVGLSGALSQWSGGTRSATEVSEILASAMLGERDALKGLGISITEADVQQQLLKNGTSELTGAALEQAKAVATQELIFAKSKDAQAAYASGSGSLLSKQAALHAKFSELTEGIATGLTPILHSVISFVTETAAPAVGRFIAKIQTWLAENKPLIKQLTAFAGSVLSTLVAAIGNVARWVGTLIGKITSNKDAMNVLRGAVGFLATAFGVVSTVIGTVVGAVGGFIDKLTKNQGVVSVFKGVINSVASAFRTVRDTIGWVVDRIGDLIGLVKSAIGWLKKLGDFKINLPIPQFAHGGPIAAGTLSVVGEKGPELFVPKTDGVVIPHEQSAPFIRSMSRASSGSPMQMAGGGGLTINFQSTWPPTTAQAREIATMVDSQLYYRRASSPR